MRANNNFNFQGKKVITSQDSENIQRFFTDIKNYPSLTKGEERELIIKYQRDKDPKALDKLIKANLRFAVTVAKTYQGQGVPLLDLIQEASAGMVEAAKRFDIKHDLKYFSYAVWWIKIMIISTFDLHKRVISIPANRVQLITKLKRKTHELENKLQRTPTLEELSKFFPSQSEEDLSEALAYSILPTSLQSQLFDQEVELVEVLRVENHLEIDEENKRESFLHDLNSLLYQLPQRSYDVMVLIGGLNGEEVWQQDKVMYNFEIDLRTLTKLRAKGMKFLKKFKDRTKLNEYL